LRGHSLMNSYTMKDAISTMVVTLDWRDGLGQNFLGHVAVDISQSKIAPGIIEGQLLVV